MLRTPSSGIDSSLATSPAVPSAANASQREKNASRHASNRGDSVRPRGGQPLVDPPGSNRAL